MTRHAGAWLTEGENEGWGLSQVRSVAIKLQIATGLALSVLVVHVIGEGAGLGTTAAGQRPTAVAAGCTRTTRKRTTFAEAS